MSDFRLALRQLVSHPGFSIVAVLTLALGIGANTAIFSVLDGVLLRPAPYADLDRLMMVWETDRNSGTLREPAAIPDYADFRERTRQFQSLAAFAGGETNLTPSDGDPIRLPALAVTHDFLPLVGIGAIAGRVFSAEDDIPGGPQVALIGERLWERMFERRADVVGSTLVLNEMPYTVIGVVPAGADFGALQILDAAAYNRGFADRGERAEVEIWAPLRNPIEQIERDIASWPLIDDWRRETTTLTHVVAVRPVRANLTGEGAPEVVNRILVSEGFFPMLGVAPARGRALQPEDNVPGNHQVAVLSDGLWRRRYGADPAIVGRDIQLNGEPFVVVGIAALRAAYPADADLWTPLALTGPLEALGQSRTALWLPVVGRLRPGVTLAQAQADMSALSRGLEERFPENRGMGVLLEALQATLVRDVRPALLVLFGAAGFVVLLVTANLTNLLLARGTARRRALAVRRALGAGRWEIFRQVLAESLLLGLAGGVTGMLLATWTLGALRGVAPTGLDWLGSIGIDPAVRVFTLAVAVATGIACGLPAALRASRGDLQASLGDAGRGGIAGRAAGRIQRSLVAAQVGLAVLLLAGAGLMVRSALRLRAVDPGLELDRVLTFRVSLPAQRYPGAAAVNAFYEGLLERLRAEPRVESADAITDLMLGRLPGSSRISLDDESARDEVERPLPIPFDFVTPGFFRTVGIPLHQGRAFNSSDRPGAPLVAIVNQTFARRFFPGRDPIGRRWIFGDAPTPDAEWYTIVGVVAAARRTGLDQTERPLIYLPASQAEARNMTVVVRAAGLGDPLLLTPLARQALATVDSELPLSRLRSVAQLMAESVAERRFLMLLLGALAGLAVVVAAVGVYGVMAYVVGQRTREIGVRLALGACSRDVLRQFLRDGMASVAPGLALGVLAALLLTRLLQRFLFEVSATDPPTFAGVGILLAAVALLASYLPARRAARVDPMEALRDE